ncbi:DUF4906 domain-containing protein [Phocaeicola sp.]
MKIRAYFITLSFLLATLMACQDETLNLPAPAMPDSTVPVELSIGFADEEDGYGTGNDSRTVTGVGDDAATGLDAQLVPETKSRAGDEMKPNGLYQLHIMQMQQNGTAVKTFYTGTTQVTGGHIDITASLNVMDHCKLVIAVRGEGITTPAFPGALSGIQNLVSTTSFSGIPTEGASQEQINKMPYVLYLEDVNIVKVNDKFVIQSPDGKDVRIRLKRLAAKLTVKWKFNVTDYKLEEVRLCQMPKDFYFLPEREKNDIWTDQSYPTLVKEYIDYFRLTGDELTGGTVDDATASGTVSTEAEGYSVYTTWLPANAKGTAPEATAPSYRNKDIAPTGAGYLEFVAVKKNASNEIEERLFYRVYLGGKETTDFNVRENTNYVWTVNITGANYSKDPRIDRQETTPVPQKDDNFKPTSNCFMVQPNSSFSFNPYKHEAGTNGWNDELIDLTGDTPAYKSKGDDKTTEITSMKVYWQSKDAGTTGTLVMGYRLSEDNYSNQVNFVSNTGPENARAYIRVPYSKGGNAVLAAYNSANDIVWSWHLWITNYVPARINPDRGYDDYADAQKRSLNGTVHKYRSDLWKKGGMYENMVMMDRELGARAGGFPGLSKGKDYTDKDAVDRQGLLYQWGRKDPFFGSVDGTTNEINVIFDGDGKPKKVDNIAKSSTIYGSDGTSLNYSVMNPLSFIYYWGNGTSSDWWSDGTGQRTDRWNKGGVNAPGKKNIYDPSPYGWKVPMKGSKGYIGSSNSRNYFEGSIFDKLQEVVGSATYKASGDYSLNNKDSYFKYSPYCYNGTFYWKNEYAANINQSNNNAKGGRIFFLDDNLTLDNQNSWTIHNTFWFPAAAERHPASPNNGKLQNPSLGHIWTADYEGSLFCIKPTQIQLGIYGYTYGWSIRCIQDSTVN